MNMFKAFESRVSEAFGAAQQGLAAPFSFRKLARRAAREMESETYVIDGIDTAPGLITVLVSADDDAVLRPAYAELTQELASFTEAEAARKGYVFVGKPLARFMVDASLKHGRFAVFANNVDSVTLEKLREEEEAFLSGFGAIGGAASPAPAHSAASVEQLETLEPLPPLQDLPNEVDDSAVGLSVMPDEFVDELEQEHVPSAAAVEARALAEALPDVVDVAATPLATSIPDVVEQEAAQAVVPPIDVPAIDALDDAPGNVPAPVATDEDEPVTCLLIDRQSGRTYVGTAPKTTIGRERTPGGIVLRDPNVSRQHAEMTFDGTTWRIHDLASTNGTLVNDVDIDHAVLRDGDIITLGLLNLEFRES